MEEMEEMEDGRRGVSVCGARRLGNETKISRIRQNEYFSETFFMFM